MASEMPLLLGPLQPHMHLLRHLALQLYCTNCSPSI
ncbi:hypothetical protein OIU78_014553, partial [Salix suchowensis]